MLPILQVGDVLLSPDILTEYFCCDLEACGGECCIEGEAGAPITMEEIDHLEAVLAEVWDDLSPKARKVINREGVSTIDPEGDLVTTIVNGKDCVFTCYGDFDADGNIVFPEKGSLPNGEGGGRGSLCLCATEKAFREGRTSWPKPISCYLYPIREKRLSNGTVALNYHRWKVCEQARKKGRELNLRVYEFLKDPLVRRFGADWYAELEELVDALKSQGLM